MNCMLRVAEWLLRFPGWVRDALALIILSAVLLPRSVMEVAAKVGYEMHVVSFILGPATYTFSDGLAPGRDYFTQYSLGLPFIFSWMLGGSADHAVLSYAKLMITAMLVFYGGLYFLLRWLFRSKGWALAVSLTVLILQFHVDRTFFDPSSYVLRYPLLIVSLALLGVWARNIENILCAIALCLTLASSLFLNTELAFTNV